MWGEITTWLTPGQFTLRHIHIYIRDNSTVFLLFFFLVQYSLVSNLLYQVTKTSHLTIPSLHCAIPISHLTILLSHLVFFSLHLTVLFSHYAVLASHVTVLFSHLVVPLFFLILSSSNITFNSTFVHDFETQTRLYGPIRKPLKPSFLQFF